jgi:hypothetical protein
MPAADIIPAVVDTIPAVVERVYTPSVIMVRATRVAAPSSEVGKLVAHASTTVAMMR